MAAETTSLEAFRQELEAAPLDVVRAVVTEISRRQADRPLSLEQFQVKSREEAARSFGESASTFGKSFLTGAGAMAKEGGKAIGEIAAGEAELTDVKRGLWDVGRHDFVRFAKTLGGAARDRLGGYTDEQEEIREYLRYRDNFDYYQKVRPTLIEATGTEAKAFVGLLGEFTDPTLLWPVAGPILKGGAFVAKSTRLAKAAKALEKAGEVAAIPSQKIAEGVRWAGKRVAGGGAWLAGKTGRAGEITSKVAAFPRQKLAQVAGGLFDQKAAGGALLTGQVYGSLAGASPWLSGLTGAEIVGYIANKTGRGIERVATALAQPSGQKRFLQRLAQSAESPKLRRLALLAHRTGGTWLGDRAFNMLVNGVSVGTLNAALAVAAGEGAEGAGQAAGAGFVLGGMMPFGQLDQVGGKSQAARDASTINFLEAKYADDQLKTFREMSPEARLMFATTEEAGIPAPKLTFLDKEAFLEVMRRDDPSARKAEDAMFDPIEKAIYVNRDGNMKKGSREAMDLLGHELGHNFLLEAIKDDPFFARHVLSEFEAEPGKKSHRFAFTRDASGDPIDFIDINQKGKDIADAYSSISEDVAIGNDANQLASEIGADQFAMMMADDPNLFKHISPPLRHKLLDAGRKVLTLFGAAEPDTGNPLALTISPLSRRSPAIRRLYRNYLKQREWDMAARKETADRGQPIPVRKGETADQAVERMFGSRGLTLREAGAFRIKNKQVKAELVKLKDRLVENPERDLWIDRNMLVGKKIPDELRAILTKNDHRGTINVILNDVLEAIRKKLEVNFLYRSGRPSKYSDNELKVRVVQPVGIRVTGLSPRSKGAASVKLDTFDMAYLRNNLEVLVREGLIDDPNAFIEEARRVVQESLDKEGRINPKGEYENEMVTALFGHPESAPSIRDPKLRRLLEDKKLQHSFRSYDIDALAGLAPTGKTGIGFDWDNVKLNYSPHGKDFMPAPRDETVPLPFIEDLGGEEPAAGFKRVATQKMRKADFEKFQEPLSRAEAQEAMGNQSQVQPFQPRFPRGERQFMPAAYHGTPHTFKAEEGAPMGRFRSAQIGTGEGAQAYGHGLYFAGKKQVAEHYRETLFRGFRPKDPDKNPITFEIDNILEWATEDGRVTDKKKVIQKINDRISLFKKRKGRHDDYELKVHRETLDLINDGEVIIGDKGSLYKVELAPKENEYLLWDKPLSEQPKGVREKLQGLAFLKDQKDALGAFARGSKNAGKVITGGEAYRKMVSVLEGHYNLTPIPDKMHAKVGQQLADSLTTAGIPGIKYLEGASRAKGKGDYNYVIFDEGAVTITEKLFMPAPAPDSKAFKKWYGKDSPRDADGAPTLLYHGTTADIKSFDPSIANPEGDLGKAIYLTNSPKDVSANYASEAGPDLTNRIARRAEALEAEGLPQADAEAKARAESLDNLGVTMPVYASMKKAFKVGGPDETQFTFKWKFDEDGNIIGEEGTMIELIEAISQAARKYDGNGEEAIGALMDFVADNGERIPASQVMKILKEHETFGYLSDDAGNLVGNEVIREAVQRLGFDGIEDHTVYEKFGPGREKGQPMEGIDENTVHYAVFKPEQVKSAFNRGTFDAGESNILYMPASDSPDLPYKVSTRNPTAVKASENPLTSDLVIGLEAIEADPKMLHSHAFALQEYPGIKRTSRSPKVIAEKFIDHVVDNLLWLYDQVAPEVRERSRLWYDGARRIVDRWSEEFGSTYKTIGGTRSTAREKQGIAAALAALSPQKDWFMNVDLTRRILDVMTFKKREKFDSAMVDKYVEKFSESLGRKEASKIANAMKGKTLEELPTNYEQAAFIRAYDEVYNPREYQIVSPEGDFIGISRKQNGEPDSVAWGSMSEIAKAVRVLRDPSHRNISEALGKAHKIRNFYNNILLPKADKLSVTIDTHAIAAALLRALAGHDLEVANNFGVKPKGAKRSIKNSSVTGIQGTYGIYADAYRKAAEARGVLPREMQSITWEAIRGLFEAKWKTKGNKAKVDNLWKKYENGSLTLNETRQAILDLAEGIKDPEWVGRRSNRGTDESLGAPENAQQLPRPELGRQELRSKPRGRVSDAGDVPPEVGRQFMPAGQPATPAPRRAGRPAPRGNRFMAPASKRVAEEGPGRLFMPKDMSRKEAQSKAKEFGFPAGGKTEEIVRRIEIAERDPKSWSRDEFDLVKDRMWIHQTGWREAEVRRTPKEIMSQGMKEGRWVDPVGNLDRGDYTWARQLGGLLGTDAYLFWSKPSNFKEKGSPILTKGAKPFFHFKPREKGQNVYEAITGKESAPVESLPSLDDMLRDWAN